MKWGLMDVGVRCWRGDATRLLAGVAVAAMLWAGTAAAQSVVFKGSTFVNEGLVGVARVPSDARDQFGDTLGGSGRQWRWISTAGRRTATAATPGRCSWCLTAAGTPRVQSIFAVACIASA